MGGKTISRTAMNSLGIIMKDLWASSHKMRKSFLQNAESRMDWRESWFTRSIRRRLVLKKFINTRSHSQSTIICEKLRRRTSVTTRYGPATFFAVVWNIEICVLRGHFTVNAPQRSISSRIDGRSKSLTLIVRIVPLLSCFFSSCIY